MSEEQIQQQMDFVHDRVKKLEKEAHEMKVVISGGDLTEKPGVLQNILRIINAMFDEKEGVVPRLTAMERRELERKGWLKGAEFMWMLIGGVVVWLLTKFVFK